MRSLTIRRQPVLVVVSVVVAAAVLSATTGAPTVGASDIDDKRDVYRAYNEISVGSLPVIQPTRPTSLHAPAIRSSHRTSVNHSLQLNIYGTNGGSGGYNTNIANDVNNSLAHRNPLTATISLNEACMSQWLQIWNASLKGKGYTATAHWSLPHTSNTSCGKFGNVAIIFGTAHPAFASGQFNAQGPGDEKKGWACVQSDVLQAWSCTAHTIWGNKPMANAQMLEYWNAMGLAILAGHPMWAAGDFNLNPWDPNVTSGAIQDLFYYHFEEADGPVLVAKRPTTDYGGCCRYDYVFRRQPAHTTYDASIWAMAHSDHHWVEMYNG